MLFSDVSFLAIFLQKFSIPIAYAVNFINSFNYNRFALFCSIAFHLKFCSFNSLKYFFLSLEIVKSAPGEPELPVAIEPVTQVVKKIPLNEEKISLSPERIHPDVSKFTKSSVPSEAVKPKRSEKPSKVTDLPTGLVVKDYAGNIITEYMGKPEKMPDPKTSKTIKSDKSLKDKVPKSDSSETAESLAEDITRAFPKDLSETENIIDQNIEPKVKKLEKIELTRAFETSDVQDNQKEKSKPEFRLEKPKEFGIKSSEKDRSIPKEPFEEDPDVLITKTKIDRKHPKSSTDEIIKKIIDSKQPNETLVLRFVITRSDGSIDPIEEIEIDFDITEDDIKDTLDQIINDIVKKLTNPKDEARAELLKRAANEMNEEELVADFIVHPENLKTKTNDIIEKTSSTFSQLNPSEKVLIRLIIINPDGSEYHEEIVLEPDYKRKDIEKIINDILEQSASKFHSPDHKAIFKILKRKPRQKRSKESSEEPIGEFKIDPKHPEKIMDDIIQKTTSKARDPTRILILRIVRKIPGLGETIEEFPIISKQPEQKIVEIIKNLQLKDPREEILAQFLSRNKPKESPRRSPDDLSVDIDDKIVIRVIFKKPNGEKSVEEFEIPSDATKKDIEDAIRRVNKCTERKIKDPNVKIITKVVKTKLDGRETSKEYEIDPKNALKSIDEIIRKNVSPKQNKIITRVVIKKQDGTEVVEEIELDPEIDDIDAIIKEKINKNTAEISGPAKISTRVIKQRSGEEEEIEEFEMMQEEEDQSDEEDEPIKEFEIDAKDSTQKLGEIVSLISKSKNPAKQLVIRFLIISPDGDSIEEFMIDQDTPDSEISDIINEILITSSNKAKNPKSKLICSIYHRKVKDEYVDEELNEFDIDVKCPDKNLKEIVASTIDPVTKSKNPDERLVLQIVILDPNGGESIEEIEIDPRMSRDETNDLIKEIFLTSPSKIKNAKDKVRVKFLKRKFKKKDRNAAKDVDDLVRKTVEKSTTPSKRLQSVWEEIIEEIEFAPTLDPNRFLESLRRSIKASSQKSKDLQVRIIIRMISLKPSREEIIEQFEMSPNTSDKEIDAVSRKIIRTISSRPKQSREKIIIRILRRKPGSQDSLEEESIESDIDDIIRKKLRTQTSTIRDNDGKIITKIIRLKPEGEDTMEEVQMDPHSTEDDINETIRKAIHTSRRKDPNGRMITRIIRIKPDGEESSEELEMNPDMSQKEIDEMICKAVCTTASRMKQPTEKVITRIVRLKPGGSESIEELEIDPELSDSNRFSSTSPHTKIITRVVRQVPGGDEETVEEFETIPDHPDSDIDDAIRDSIRSAEVDITDPNIKVITRVIRMKPDGAESIEEFEMDAENSDGDIDDIIRKAIRTRSLTIKDPTGKIITRVVRKKSDGQESIDESVEMMDPTVEESSNIGNLVRKTIRDTISPVKDKAGNLISRAFKQQDSKIPAVKPRTSSSTTAEPFGFMRKTYSSAVKQAPSTVKGKSPPLKSGHLTKETSGSSVSRHQKPKTDDVADSGARKTSLQERVGNKFGKFVSTSHSSSSSSRESSKSKTPPQIESKPRMTFRYFNENNERMC